MRQSQKKVVILVEKDFEDIELLYPYYRLIEEGYKVDLAGPSADVFQGKHGYPVRANVTFDDLKPENYEAVIIPGGKAPEYIRMRKEAVEFVKKMNNAGKLVATICHGPQVLISAGVLNGRKITCVPSIRDDVVNAGATYVDEPVVADGNLVSSRYPPDLPYFAREVVKRLKEKS